MRLLNTLRIDFSEAQTLLYIGGLITTCLFAILLARTSYNYGRAVHIRPMLPQLEQRWYLFGIDTLLQDILDLHNHQSSLRSLQRHRTHGTTYYSTFLGQPTIHTIDPANILAMTTHNFDEWGRGDWTKIIARYMGKGILVNDGKEWHASRTMLKQLFKRNKAADIRSFEEHVDRWIEYLRQQDGKFVDFRRATQMLVLDIVTDMLCGRSTCSVPDPADRNSPVLEERGLLDLIDELEPYGNIAIELGPLSLPIFICNYGTIMALVKGIQAFFRKSVLNTMQSKCQDPTIIEQMLAEGLSARAVQGELQNIFFAAFDTTTALITNLFDCVARDRHLQTRLRAEINNVEVLNETTLPLLTLLRATIFEALRLHSPVTQHTRKARKDTFLQGQVFIPKGTSVIWSTYALNRNLSICSETDALDFQPDRWLDKDKLRVDQDFMPFGSGPRNCLGQQFALQLVTYVAAKLLGSFEGMGLEGSEKEFEEAAAVTYYNGRGTRFKFWW